MIKSFQLATYLHCRHVRIWPVSGQHLPHSNTSDQSVVHTDSGLPEGGITATFSREQALGRDDMHFLTWEHPMVSGAMDMVLGGEFGNAAVGV